MRWTNFLPLVLALIVVASLAVTPALAGGRGGGNGNSEPATLTLTPHNPLDAWGQQYTISGTGFNPNAWIYFSTNCCGSFNRWSDSGGNFSMVKSTAGPGTYVFDAFQWEGKKFVKQASLSFAVE